MLFCIIPPTSSHTTASTWPTPYNIHDLHGYAINICNTPEYIETSPTFRRRFDRFIGASLGKAIAGVEAEETLREYKEETQERAKRQSGSRKIVAKDGVLKAGEAAERIRSRRKNEVEQARWTAQLRGRRGNARKILARQLECLAELDNPNRLNKPSDRAVSI